jgi:hypothetical protein
VRGAVLHRCHIEAILRSKKGGREGELMRGERKDSSDRQQFLPAFHLYALLGVGVFIIARQNFLNVPYQQFVYLAKSFLDGHLYFTTIPEGWGDTSYYNGHHYWPLGPLPAIILMPFVAVFGMAVKQGYLLFVFNMLNLFLLYKIARKITQNHVSSLWLNIVYVFGTAYLAIALVPWSWFFAQAVASSFLLLALYEFYYEKRWWLIGLYSVLAVATRIDIIFIAVFFGLSIMFEDEKKSEKMKQLVRFSIPFLLGVVSLMMYDYMRFGNIFETGYGFPMLYDEQAAANRGYGIWNLIHFRANLYYLLLKGPMGVFIPGTKVLTYPYLRTDGWGMSIIFTSPIFFWIFKAPFKKTAVWLSILTSLLMLIFFLGYFAIGFFQYGYRYALDFYPFLFVALAYSAEKEFSLSMKIITLGSFLFNYCLMIASGIITV